MEGGNDPYEKQLLDVFESCDFEGSGRLDSSGLTQLCDKLQLEEQGVKLIDCLLANNSQRRVSFTEFREALLSLLGEGQKQKKFERSPEREVSPKYVFGKKKYGRRSRPESIDQDSDEACNTEESDSEVFLQNPVPKKDNLLWPVADVSEPSKTKVYKKRRKSVDRRLVFDKEITSQASSEENFSKARVSRLSSDEEGQEKEELVELNCFSTADETVKVASSNSMLLNSEDGGSQETFINMTLEAREEADNLRSVCKQLGIGQDGSLNKTQLTRLCKCIGMETKAEYIVQELFEKLDVDMENRISFEEFLSLFLSGDVGAQEERKDDGLEELPNKRDDQTVTSGYSNILADPLDRNTVVIGSEKDSLPFVLDVNNSGCMSLESIVGLWSSWGVSQPEKLVENLGFGSEEQVPFSTLYSTVESELRLMLADESEEEEIAARGDPKMDIHTPAPSSESQLLRAALGLYLTETKLLKVSMDHMRHERDKLQMDLAEANHRASLLAQEVDDHHARLEKSSQLQVKLLEQRHSEIIRELQDQSCAERDALSSQNAELEKKLFELQTEECHLREECLSLQTENEMLEKENQSLLEQVAKCEEDKLKLTEQIEMLSCADQEQGSEINTKKWALGKEEKGIGPVIEKLAALQEENRSLRDRNDELTMELEAAMSKLSASTFNKNEGNKFAWLKSELAADAEVHFSGDTLKEDEMLSQSEKILVGMKMEDSSTRTPLYEEIEGELEAEELSSNFSLSLPGESIEASLKVEGDDLWSVSKDNIPKHEEARVPELEHSLQLDSKQLQADLVTKADCTIEKGNNEDTRNVVLQSKQLTKAIEEFEKEAEKHISRIEESEEKYVNNKRESNGSLVDVLDCAASVFTSSQVKEMDNSISNATLSLNIEKQNQNACKDLKTKLDFVKFEIVKILSEKEACSAENSALRYRIFNLVGDSNNSDFGGNAPLSVSSTEGDPINGLGVEKMKSLEKELEEMKQKFKETEEKHKKEKEALMEQCREMESSLELMNMEYEKCEDYWQLKLEEERNFYEEAQRLMDEKQSSLEQKISEYAEMFCQNDKNECGSRLSTIEERVSLERQVTDLEEECEELRAKMKESELLQLRHFEEKERISLCLEEMEQRFLKDVKKDSIDAAVQVDVSEFKQQNGIHQKVDANTKLSSKSSRAKGVTNGGSTSCLALTNNMSHFSCQQCHGKSSVDNLFFEREAEDSGRNRILAPNANTKKNMANEVGDEENDEWLNNKGEVESLEAILSSTRERLHKQSLICQNQAERLVQSDVLVQKLYLENAFLRNYLQQCQEY